MAADQPTMAQIVAVTQNKTGLARDQQKISREFRACCAQNVTIAL
jgi:hypothetical protein